jgi:hypothetical protein
MFDHIVRQVRPRAAGSATSPELTTPNWHFQGRRGRAITSGKKAQESARQAGGTGGRFLIVVPGFQHLRGSDNPDALELPKVEKMRISGDDVIHLTGEGAFEDHVVVGIGLHNVNATTRHHQVADRFDLLDYGRGDFGRVPELPSTEHTFQFLKNLSGKYQVDRLRERSVYDLLRIAPKMRAETRTFVSGTILITWAVVPSSHGMPGFPFRCLLP